MHPAADSASEEIFSRGYACVRLSVEEVAYLEKIVNEAKAFFALPIQQRMRYAHPQANLGYRNLGHEYPSAGRPDWNECFTLWSDRTDFIPCADEIPTLTMALIDWRSSISSLAADLLDRIGRHFGAADVPISTDTSFLQVNSYSLGPTERDLLQDPHEDGYLITIIHATGPGLEISLKGGKFAPVQTASDEILIMPGEILDDLTGRRVRALGHQVRNLNLVDRLSVMYFVGPDLSRPLYEWPNDALETQNVDLRPRIRSRVTPIHLPG
jgi:isopenicillin N synthase-like dioxygenase